MCFKGWTGCLKKKRKKKNGGRLWDEIRSKAFETRQPVKGLLLQH